MGTSRLEGRRGVKQWMHEIAFQAEGTGHNVPGHIPDLAGASGWAAEEECGQSGWEPGRVRLLATGRSLACMLISEGFEQRRGMKGLPCHKTTPVSGFRKRRLGAKVPLR